MDKRKQLFLAIAVFIIALLGNKWYIGSQIDQVRDKKFVKVVKAKKSMEAGQLLNAGAIEPVSVPEAYAPRARIRWEEHDQFLQQPLATNVIAGDYVLETAFGKSASVGRTLSQQLEGEDFRAVTLTVDETNSFSRSIVSGDRIDILFTFTAPPLRQKLTTSLLQNVPVIATGGYSAASQELGDRGSRGGKYNTITLKVPVQDALRLTYARQAGTINILLRSIRDNKTTEMPILSGVQDVLSPADKATVDNLIRQMQANITTTGERGEAQIREQAKAAIEQQRKQIQQLGVNK
ncbi:MAG: Flp pilus assembly protein CpaB [Bdellovibrionota bacterium]